MHRTLKLPALVAALMLAGCGGSESDAPATPSVAYAGTLLAGVATTAYNNPGDPEPGCADGAALGAKLDPFNRALARTGDGQLLLSESGACDGLRRIRAIDTAANTIQTLAVGAPSGEERHEALTSFLTPTSIAVAPSGEVYIGDGDVFTGQIPSALRQVPGRGAGIWKLGTGGTVSLLAGVALPSMQNDAGADGQGAAASFGVNVGAMCQGTDGLLYVNDNRQLRTVTADGLVSTVAREGTTQQVILACGPDGSVLVRRRFENTADDDYYDPVARQSIAKASVVGKEIVPLAYFGRSHPSVLIQTEGSPRALALLNLADGSTTAISAAGLEATFPAFADAAMAGLALDSRDFVLLTPRAVLRLTRQ